MIKISGFKITLKIKKSLSILFMIICFYITILLLLKPLHNQRYFPMSSNTAAGFTLGWTTFYPPAVTERCIKAGHVVFSSCQQMMAQLGR